MEIDKNKLNKDTKAILSYCLCVLLFLMLNKIHVAVYVSLFISNILDFATNNRVSDDLALGFCIMVIIWHIYVYITTIFCGIFKKLKNLGFKTTVLIIIVINFIFYYFSSVRLYHNEWYAHISPNDAISDYYFWIIPVYFLIYKFWGYITKNSVINLEKIEYYMSIDYMIDVLFKIVGIIKNNSQK